MTGKINLLLLFLLIGCSKPWISPLSYDLEGGVKKELVNEINKRLDLSENLNNSCKCISSDSASLIRRDHYVNFLRKKDFLIDGRIKPVWYLPLSRKEELEQSIYIDFDDIQKSQTHNTSICLDTIQNHLEMLSLGDKYFNSLDADASFIYNGKYFELNCSSAQSDSRNLVVSYATKNMVEYEIFVFEQHSEFASSRMSEILNLIYFGEMKNAKLQYLKKVEDVFGAPIFFIGQ